LGATAAAASFSHASLAFSAGWVLQDELAETNKMYDCGAAYDQ
jgi:hypothetical protein